MRRVLPERQFAAPLDFLLFARDPRDVHMPLVSSVFRSLLPFVLLAAITIPKQVMAAAGDRPNILFAFADDWGRYASAYAELEPGGPSDIVDTPHFDRVAREGVLFRHAFVNAPSCTPCRSSLLSGQYFWRTGQGAILQGAIWDNDIPSWPLLLKDAGYHIGYTYKVWSPGQPANAPYGAAEFAYHRRGTKFNRFSQRVSEADDPQRERQALFDEVRGNFADFLADRPDGQPFCYWFGPTNVHRTWTQGSGKTLWDMNPDELKGRLPPFLPDNEVVREDFCDYLGEVKAFDAALGVILEELRRTGELDRTIIVVSGDHGAPGFSRGKCNLYDFGVAVPLAIRWGNKVPGGRVVDDFVCLPDLAPTFLESAGEPPPDVMTARSLLPILLSDGSGTIDESRDAVIVGRERHVAAARTDHLPYPQRAIRTKDFLYVRNFQPDRWPMGIGPGFGEPDGPMPTYEDLERNTFAAFGDLDASPTKAWILTHRGEPELQPFVHWMVGRLPSEELYALQDDPHQIHNVANSPEYAAVKRQLSERLTDVLTSTGDPRVTGDGTQFDRPPFAGPIPRRR